jgi:hypothetical protein
MAAPASQAQQEEVVYFVGWKPIVQDAAQEFARMALMDDELMECPSCGAGPRKPCRSDCA